MSMSQLLQEQAALEERLCARVAAMLEEHRPSEPASPSARGRARIGIFASRGTMREGGWDSYGADRPTVNAFAEAGACPLELPTYPILPGLDIFDIFTDEQAFRYVFDTIWPLVRDLDGIVFTGGGDLDSRFFYRKIPHPRLLPPDIWRDTWEWFTALIAWALFRAAFGICRGAQLMNVVLLGGLFQDDEELQRRRAREMPEQVAHRRGRPVFKNLITHPVVVVPNSVLAHAVRGPGEHAAPRYHIDEAYTQHHNFIGLQTPGSTEVIGDLADGLAVVGYAPDMVIEAVASRDPRRMYWAVQFHPEYTKELAWSSAIFSYVVQGCARDVGIDRALFEAFREEVRAWLWLRGRALHELQQPAGGAARAELNGHAIKARETDALSEELQVASSSLRAG